MMVRHRGLLAPPRRFSSVPERFQDFCHFQGIPKAEGYAFQNSLSHIGPGGVHAHADEHGADVRIIVWGAFSHQIGEEKHLIFSRFTDLRLFRRIVIGVQDVFRPPFIAGGGAEHTAHQMVMPVCVGEGMQRIVTVHAEGIAGNKDGAGGAKGNIAAGISHRSGAHSCRRVVAGAGDYFYFRREGQLRGDVRAQSSGYLIAFVQSWQLIFCDVTQIQHFL